MFFAHMAIELTGNLLLFALMMSCAAKWKHRTVIASLPVVYLTFWLTGAFGVFHFRYSELGYGNWFLASLPFYGAGFVLIALNGWRRSGEQPLRAAAWPRTWLLAGFAFSFLACTFTYRCLQLPA